MKIQYSIREILFGNSMLPFWTVKNGRKLVCVCETEQVANDIVAKAHDRGYNLTIKKTYQKVFRDDMWRNDGRKYPYIPVHMIEKPIEVYYREQQIVRGVTYEVK